jgi:hypothetical protein
MKEFCEGGQVRGPQPEVAVCMQVATTQKHNEMKARKLEAEAGLN